MNEDYIEKRIITLRKGLEICNSKINSKNPFIFKRKWKENKILIEAHILDLESMLKILSIIF